jgi:hypothetical protein
MVASEVVGYEERQKRNDWYYEEWQIKAEERNNAQVTMLNRQTRLTIENYRNKRRKAKKICTG